jgi:undecaprenyl-diphosphatase
VDYQIEQWVNGPAGHHAALDTLMRDAANWGEWIFIGLVVAWFASSWLWGDRTERRFALTALLASGIALGINQILGAIWNRPRPFVAHPHDVHLLLAHAADGSFPSDHAAAGFAVAGVLVAAHRRLGAAAIALAVLMSYARVFVGPHYPGDVVAQQRLTVSLERLRAAGIPVRGAFGDADPLRAIDDAMRVFHPDEIIIATHPPGRSNWLERDVVAHARKRFDVPITHVEVDSTTNAAHVIPSESGS